MSRSDYLLAAAICCQLKNTDYWLGSWAKFGTFESSDRYAFRAITSRYDKKYRLGMEILLDGTPIAHWSDSYNFHQYRGHCVLEPLDNAEAVILAALGMGSETESILGILLRIEDMQRVQPKLEVYHLLVGAEVRT